MARSRCDCAWAETVSVVLGPFARKPIAERTGGLGNRDGRGERDLRASFACRPRCMPELQTRGPRVARRQRVTCTCVRVACDLAFGSLVIADGIVFSCGQ